MKFKILQIITASLIAFSVNAQSKYLTRTGTVEFFSTTPVEDIKATNNQVSSILMPETKTVAFNVLMRSFKFDKALMEEHFNEKYVESETYPAAKFKGVIMDPIDFNKSGTYDNVKVEGTMNFHGVSKKIVVYGTVDVNAENETITTKCEFLINLEEYKIDIPGLVRDKIAKDIKVSTQFIYTKAK